MAEDTEEQQDSAQASKGGGLKKLLLPGAGALIVALALVQIFAPGLTARLGLGAAPADAEAIADGDGAAQEQAARAGRDARYVPLRPPLLVNFEEDDKRRFMQVTIDLMAYGQQAVDDIKLHDAVIRNSLLLMLGDVEEASVASREGKEQLQAEALETVRTAMEQHVGDPTVEGLFLTSLIVQ